MLHVAMMNASRLMATRYNSANSCPLRNDPQPTPPIVKAALPYVILNSVQPQVRALAPVRPCNAFALATNPCNELALPSKPPCIWANTPLRVIPVGENG